jgi:hypothetical protein
MGKGLALFRATMIPCTKDLGHSLATKAIGSYSQLHCQECHGINHADLIGAYLVGTCSKHATHVEAAILIPLLHV